MAIRELKKLGLTPGEIKVYESLINFGESTKTKLAKRSEVSPSKIYDIANRLIRKGIVTAVKKQGVMHFKAANPKRLGDFVKNKEQEIKGQKDIVDKILPSLLAKYQQNKEDVDIDVYYGWDGLKTAFLHLENSAKKKDTSDVFGASVGLAPKQGDIFWKQHQLRVEKLGYKVRIIFNEDLKKNRKQRYEYYVEHPLHEIRYLHQKTLTEFYVYNEAVLILISLETPIGIMVKSKETVKSFRQFFQTLWKQAKK
ncbi:hypothetical protein HOC01_03785 [archaeon]|jgi:predicted transcriptional regulator|nr:hypothetical protein [archaeon]MBT6698467.1 hypothetical protein [archaeon]